MGARIDAGRRDTRSAPKPPDPRKKPGHLDFIRSLCCVKCGAPSTAERRTQPAHIRLGNHVGGAGKPDDKFTVPLCADCHTLNGRQAQHNAGEQTFWQGDLGIDPMDVAAALFTHSGDEDRGQAIVFKAWQRSQLHRQREQS